MRKLLKTEAKSDYVGMEQERRTDSGRNNFNRIMGIGFGGGQLDNVYVRQGTILVL